MQRTTDNRRAPSFGRYPTKFADGEVQSEVLIVTAWHSVPTSISAQGNIDPNNNETGDENGAGNSSNNDDHYWGFLFEAALVSMIHGQPYTYLLRLEDTCLNESRVLRLKDTKTGVPPSIQRVQQVQWSQQIKDAAPSASSTRSKSQTGLLKGFNKLSWNKSGQGASESRWKGLGGRTKKTESNVVIRLRERFSFEELTRPMDVVVLYFNLVGIRSMRVIEDAIKHEVSSSSQLYLFVTFLSPLHSFPASSGFLKLCITLQTHKLS